MWQIWNQKSTTAAELLSTLHHNVMCELQICLHNQDMKLPLFDDNQITN